MKTALIFGVTLAIILSGCATSQRETKIPKSALDGTWKSAASNATLRFEQGKLSGNDGCNQFVGSYTTEGNTLRISDKMLSTMMACPAMEQSAAFKNALMDTKIYEKGEKRLLLIGADGKVLHEFHALSNTFEEGVYRIGYLNNGNKAVVSVKEGSSITLKIGTDGKMEGNASCNLYTTSWSMKEELITIGFPATTRKMCSGELMEQEQHFLNALQKSAKISRNGERWEMRDDNGALLFTMSKE